MSRSKLSLCGMAVIAALMLSGGLAFAASNDTSSANSVMPGCRNFASDNTSSGSDLTFKSGICLGVLLSIYYLTQSCVPPQVTNQQTARVIVQYIDARPARMHESFIGLAREAIMAAWPCKP
jgi:hypothetical protein